MIRLHVTAVTRLTRAALPGMIARRRGGVINVASRLAFSASLPSPPLPRRAVYAATKAYVNVFTQVLAGELAGTGVRVMSLNPGVVRTEFHARMPPRQFPDSIVMPAAHLVDAALAGLERGEVICVPALEDSRLLREVDETHCRLLEGSDTGSVASRYRRP
jgi:short-subunit dehydrogenase